MRLQFLKQNFSQHTKVLVEITTVAGVSRLLNGVFHVGVQPVFVPLAKCHRHRIAPALCADLVGLLLQDCNSFLPGVAAGGCAPNLAGFVVNSSRQPNLPSSVCTLAAVAFVMPTAQGFLRCVFHVVSSPFVTQRLPQVRGESYSSDPTIFGFSFWALLTFCCSSQLKSSSRRTSSLLPMQNAGKLLIKNRQVAD